MRLEEGAHLANIFTCLPLVSDNVANATSKVQRHHELVLTELHVLD